MLLNVLIMWVDTVQKVCNTTLYIIAYVRSIIISYLLMEPYKQVCIYIWNMVSHVRFVLSSKPLKSLILFVLVNRAL